MTGKKPAKAKQDKAPALGPEHRELIEQASKAADSLTVQALAREKSARDLAALRAERDGFNIRKLTMLKPSELAQGVEPLKYLIKGVWPEAGFGPFGGQKKSLKTWCAMIHAVAVALGEPSFGFEPWSVPRSRPVLYICGEGGERLVRRRLQRIAEMYGYALSDVPLYVVVGVAPFDSDEFRHQISTYTKAIRQEQAEPPGLVVLDSLYNYHPQDVEVSNLYGRGGVLASFQYWIQSVTADEFSPDGASLWTVDHFNKSGSGLDLDRYGQAGMNAWADSWWNAEVIESDPEQGHFVLRVVAASRQGYEHHYGIDITLGRFDTDRGEYEGNLKVVVTAGDPKPGRDKSTVPQHDIGNAITELLTRDPYAYTKERAATTLAKSLQVGPARVRKEWDDMVDQALIRSDERKVPEGNTKRLRTVWAVGKATPTGSDAAGKAKRHRSTPTRNPDRAKRKGR
jgi:hypothetical protein